MKLTITGPRSSSWPAPGHRDRRAGHVLLQSGDGLPRLELGRRSVSETRGPDPCLPFAALGLGAEGGEPFALPA